MSYYLHIYSLPRKYAEVPESLTQQQVPSALTERASKIGDIPFSAGESTLFAAALQDLTGVSIDSLLRGPLFGVEPADDLPAYGALTELQFITDTLNRFLNEVGTGEMREATKGQLAELDETYTLDPIETIEKLKKLCNILTRVQAQNAIAAAIYA